MSKIASRVIRSSLVTLVAAGAVSSLAGCSKPDETKQAWTCARSDVPMGEVLRCTSSALTADGPVTDGTPTGGTPADTTPTTDETTGGGSDTTVYECGPGIASPDCPPTDGSSGSQDGTSTSDTAPGSEPPIGSTEDGTAGGGGSNSSSDGAGSAGSDNSGGPTNGGGPGKSGGHTEDGTGPGKSRGSSRSSHRPPRECSYVPDLIYCDDSAGGGTADGAPSSSDGGTPSCDKPQCSAPGQGKKDSGPSHGAGSSGTTDGKHFHCTKDEDGNKSCVSTPECAPGSHPSACGACVEDIEGTGDCVAPREGGCWATGGGFIEGASVVPNAPADGHDNFGGNAKPMKRGNVSGHWNHIDHGTGNHAKGRPEYIMCRTTDGPGPGQPGGKRGLVANQVYFGGHAQWRTAADGVWKDGFWFDVVAEDHGEPGNASALKKGRMPDSYHFTIRKIDDAASGASGVIVYETKGDLSGGNIQLHPSNGGHPVVNSPLPAWVTLER